MSVNGTGRGVGVTEQLSAGEWPFIVLFALITPLGDVGLLFLIGGVLYVAGTHFHDGGSIDDAGYSSSPSC